MTVPLLLDDVVVESLFIRTSLEGPSEPGIEVSNDEPEIEVDILRSEDQPNFMVPLHIRMNRRAEDFSRQGYALDLKIVGLFSFQPGTDEEAIDRLITVNAPAILYGVARGIAAQAFAMTTAGRQWLPSVNFVEIMRQRERRLKRRQKSTQRKDKTTSEA